MRKPLTGMTAQQKLDLAEEKIDLMTSDIIGIINIHANNEILTYSPTVSDQIPQSYAANAFNVIQESLHFYEIVQLCTFWDGFDLEKSNIPTIVELVDDACVIELTSNARANAWSENRTRLYNPNPDPIIQREIDLAMQDSNEYWSKKQGEDARSRLKSAIQQSRSAMNSDQLSRTINIRDKFLAHRLATTRREKKQPIQPMIYGDETDLLKITMHLVGEFSISIKGHNIDCDESLQIARNHAKLLWENCTFRSIS